MEIENLTKRSREIITELNKGNNKNFPELLNISVELCNKYEPCKCGFISKNKKTGLCKICLEK